METAAQGAPLRFPVQDFNSSPAITPDKSASTLSAKAKNTCLYCRVSGRCPNGPADRAIQPSAHGGAGYRDNLRAYVPKCRA